MLIQLPVFNHRARIFAPAGLAVDAAALGTLPDNAIFEVVHEGALPEANPDGAIGLFFDFLLYDGSASCREWMQQLLDADVLDSMTFLLHQPSQCLAACSHWALPRFACALADEASWSSLPHALFRYMDGLLSNCYGELSSVFRRVPGYVRLFEVSVESPKWLLGSLAAQIEPSAGSYSGGGIVLTEASTLDGTCLASELVEKLFENAPWPTWQIAVNPERRTVGLTLLMAYRDGALPDQLELVGMAAPRTTLEKLPAVQAGYETLET